jgi:dTDP-glucose 4,6-dehydratase
MHRVLITGGAGFIGQNLVRAWLDARPGDRLIVLDALTYAANISSLQSLIASDRIVLIQGDIRDAGLITSVFKEYKFSRVVHLAAESHVDRSIVNPEAFLETNVLGTFRLLKASQDIWGSTTDARFLHVSTDEVYGSLGPLDPAFSEQSPYRPNSPYAASKAASDHVVRSFFKTYQLPALITNCSNNYGAYQHPEKLIPLMIISALSGRSMPIYGDGSNVRDWLHVSDHCFALMEIIERGKIGETYNVGGENEYSNRQVVGFICDAIDAMFKRKTTLKERFPHCPAAAGGSSKSLITFVTDRPGHDHRYAINSSKLVRELNVVPKTDFLDGIYRTVEWYLDNDDWWERVIDGTYKEWLKVNYSARKTL